MNKDNLYLKEQQKRISEVFEFLKKQGISQRDIVDCFESDSKIDATTLSHYKSGKIKNIPDNFLLKLQEKYNINPLYIRQQSDCMLTNDIIGLKLSNFKAFVDSWDIVERHTIDQEKNQVPEEFIHIVMDRNFYDFLIDLEKAKKVTENGISCLQEETENLKEIFSGEPKLQEFVLIPRNNFIEIVKDIVEKRKTFEELIDASEYATYLEE